MGLPDHRLLRADAPLRHAAGPHVPRRHAAPARHRRDPRLGAVALPARRARPRLLRRHAPLRARRPAPGLPSRLEQLRSSTTAATRCAPSCSRARCSGSTSTTSTACASTRSRRCSTSTTARKAGEWIPNRARRPREPRGDRRSCAASTRAVYRDYPGRADDRRGIDRLADGVAADVRRRPGLRHEVEHGLDARHAATTSQNDPIYRKYHHDELTFSLLYAFNENFVLPLSHDEVVHGKGSLLGKMPGDDWQQFANLRLLFGYMWAHPGKKLLFMGGEFGQRREWNHDASLDWHAAASGPRTRGVQRWVARPERLYRARAGAARARLRRRTASSGSTLTTADSSVARVPAQGAPTATLVLVVCNFTPVPRHDYRVGVPRGGHWREVLNSDAPIYGGSGLGNLGGVDSRRRSPRTAAASRYHLDAAAASASDLLLSRMSSMTRAARSRRPRRVVIEAVAPAGRRRPLPGQARRRRRRAWSRPTCFADGHDVVALRAAAGGAQATTDVARRRRWSRSATTAGARASASTSSAATLHRRGWVDRS